MDFAMQLTTFVFVEFSVRAIVYNQHTNYPEFIHWIHSSPFRRGYRYRDRRMQNWWYARKYTRFIVNNI